MAFYVILILTLIVIGCVAAVNNRSKKKWLGIFQKLARRHNLSLVRETVQLYLGVTGSLKGFPVSIFRRVFSKGKQSETTIGFAFEFSGFKGHLDVTPENFSRRIGRLMGKTDFQLKDKRFDGAAWVTGGHLHAVRALLHPEARKIIRHLIDSAFDKMFSLHNRHLETYQLASNYDSAEEVEEEIRIILRLGHLLTRKATIEEMLRENYLAETEEDGKTAYLESLSAVSGELKEEDAVIKSALGSSNPRLVWEAVKAIGTAGRKRIPDLFQAADAAMAVEILDYLKRKKLRGMAPYFISVCGEIRDWSLRAEVVTFLASTGTKASEKYLQKELTAGNRYPVDYLKECIKALGACGTRESIAFLHSVREGMPRRDIDAAIASIQSRLGTGESGWLSIQETKTEDGALSLDKGDDG